MSDIIDMSIGREARNSQGTAQGFVCAGFAYRAICLKSVMAAASGTVKEKSMINSNVYSYINVLDKAADAAWLRNEAISNNLANVDTPNYKRQDVSFEDELIRNLNKVEYRTMDAKVYNMQLSKIEPRVYTDAEAYSYRLDGNNVDIDRENVYMAENQITYNSLMQCVKSEFQNLKTAMGSGAGG